LEDLTETGSGASKHGIQRGGALAMTAVMNGIFWAMPLESALMRWWAQDSRSTRFEYPKPQLRRNVGDAHAMGRDK
jgi:hypothetical protein